MAVLNKGTLITCTHMYVGRLKTLKLFTRRAKRSTIDPRQSTAVSSPKSVNLPNSKAPEVDEEGYSIRPADADRITGFHDDKGTHSTSDSDSDDG